MRAQALLYWVRNILGVKAYLRISGAVLMGAILIVGALLLPKDQSADAEGNLVVTKAPLREYIEVDENNDGKADWEQLLAARIIDSIELPTTTSIDSEPYIPPTTLTGKFSESFLEEYLTLKSKGEPIEDMESLVEEAISAIDATTQSKTYAIGDLTVVQNTPENIRNYGNMIGTIVMSLPGTERNEMEFFSEAMKTGNLSTLNKIKPIQESWRMLIDEFIDLPVPTSYAELHVRFLNSFEALHLDNTAMMLVETDPVFALARLRNHYTDTLGLVDAINELKVKFVHDDVIFSEEEPMALLYRLK